MSVFGQFPGQRLVLFEPHQRPGECGGVARRHDLCRQIEKRGWEAIGLDLGGTLKRSRQQDKIKFDAVTKALRIMNYRTLGLGPEELNLEPSELIQRPEVWVAARLVASP